MSLNRPEGAVAEFKIAQDLRADIRSYQGLLSFPLVCTRKLRFGFFSSFSISPKLFTFKPNCVIYSAIFTRKTKNGDPVSDVF